MGNDDDEKNKNENKQQKSSKAASLTISLMGIGSALGRIIVGLIDEKFLSVRRISITILFPICPGLMVLSFLLPFVIPSDSPFLWFPFFLNSLAFGGSWAVVLLSMRQ